MKKTLILMAAVIAAFAMTSCSNNGDGGYKTTKDGLKYKFYVKNDTGAMPKEGDYITLNMVNRTEDTTFFRSSDNPVPMQIPMMKSQFPGDIYEAFGMMHVGDSATFVISTDSIFKGNTQPLPDFLKKAKAIYFDVKLVDVKSKDQIMKEQQEAMAKREEEAKKAKEEEPGKLAKYIKDNNIKVKPEKSGLYVVIEKQGKGKQPKKGDKVTVDYTGYLLDGTKFDSSKDHGQPFTFTLGEGRVIQGWDEGIARLREGGKAKLIIPSNLAYGKRGAGGVIPPYAPLVFDVELIKVETPKKK